jgi:hypothetical protein
MEEGTSVFELTQGQCAELESIVWVVGDLLPPDILGMVGESILPEFGWIKMTSRLCVQCLDG